MPNKKKQKAVSVYLTPEDIEGIEAAMMREGQIQIGPWIASVIRRHLNHLDDTAEFHHETEVSLRTLEKLVRDIRRRLLTPTEIEHEET